MLALGSTINTEYSIEVFHMVSLVFYWHSVKEVLKFMACANTQNSFYFKITQNRLSDSTFAENTLHRFFLDIVL